MVRAVFQYADNVPRLVVNEAVHVVGWKFWCCPILEAPVADQKEEDWGEEINPLSLPGKKEGTEKSYGES
jgi:hypothetical protein